MSMENGTVPASCITRMVVRTTDNGKKVTKVVSERTHFGTVTFMKENGRMIRNTEKAFTRTKIPEQFSKVFFFT